MAVRCRKCGTIIKNPYPRSDNTFICNDCYVPRFNTCGNPTTSCHYDDDPSGGLNSWDASVKLCEAAGL